MDMDRPVQGMKISALTKLWTLPEVSSDTDMTADISKNDNVHACMHAGNDLLLRKACIVFACFAIAKADEKQKTQDQSIGTLCLFSLTAKACIRYVTLTQRHGMSSEVACSLVHMDIGSLYKLYACA